MGLISAGGAGVKGETVYYAKRKSMFLERLTDEERKRWMAVESLADLFASDEVEELREVGKYIALAAAVVRQALTTALLLDGLELARCVSLDVIANVVEAIAELNRRVCQEVVREWTAQHS